MKKIIQDPFSLFFIAGLFIFIAYYELKDNYQPTINLSSEARVQLIEEYEAITGLKANSKVIARLEKNFISDEILFRDAINAGMHLIDPATRASLIEKMRFRISALIPEPTDAELINYYAQNMQRYYTETSWIFEHVYFTDPPKNPDSIVSQLESGEMLSGDSFVHGNQFSNISESMLRGIFGEGFLSALLSIDSTQWEGPISSNHGFHYVRLESKALPQPIAFAVAKNIIANDLIQMRTDQAVDSKVQDIIAEYEINLEP